MKIISGCLDDQTVNRLVAEMYRIENCKNNIDDDLNILPPPHLVYPKVVINPVTDAGASYRARVFATQGIIYCSGNVVALMAAVQQKLHDLGYAHFNKKYPVAISHSIIGWFEYAIIPCTTTHVRTSIENHKKVSKTLKPVVARTLQYKAHSVLVIETRSAFTWTFMDAEYAVDLDISTVHLNPSSIYFDSTNACPAMNDTIIDRPMTMGDFNITNYPNYFSNSAVTFVVPIACDIPPAFIKNIIVRPDILHAAQTYLQSLPSIEWDARIILQRSGLMHDEGDKIICSLCAFALHGPIALYGTNQAKQMALCKYCSVDCGNKLPSGILQMQTISPSTDDDNPFAFTGIAARKHGNYPIWTVDTINGPVILCDASMGSIPMIVAPLLITATEKIYVNVTILEV